MGRGYWVLANTLQRLDADKMEICVFKEKTNDWQVVRVGQLPDGEARRWHWRAL